VREGKTEEVSDVEEAGTRKTSAEILDLSELLKRSLKKGKPAKRATASDDASDAAGEERAAKPARKTTRRKRA